MDKMDPTYKEGMDLVKDKYGSERRKAKILNFSLAYGKTEYGLSKDFGVSLDEAKQIVDRWYKSRPEVCSMIACGCFLLSVQILYVAEEALDHRATTSHAAVCCAGGKLADCCETKCEERHRVASGADHAGAPQVSSRVWQGENQARRRSGLSCSYQHTHPGVCSRRSRSSNGPHQR